MIKKWFPILFAFVLIYGCGKETPPMDEELVIKVLTDLHIAEGLINNHHPVAIRDSLYPLYVKQVFDKNNINQNEFEVALAYMHRNPDYMSGIYKKILVELSIMSADLDAEEQLRRNKENDDGVDNDSAIKVDRISTSKKPDQQ